MASLNLEFFSTPSISKPLLFVLDSSFWPDFIIEGEEFSELDF